MPPPINIWSNNKVDDEDLRWLLDNQAAIIKVHPARPMPKERPIKLWTDGRVRIEFVGTFTSAKIARQRYEQLISSDC